ncbi:unnamed protein product, partial [marine sediment metagenome]
MPYCILVHGSDLKYSSRSKIDAFISSKILKNASMILVNSKYTKDRVLEKGYKRSKIKVLNPGVDTKIFQPNIDTHKIKERYKLFNRRIVLTVARLVPRKGHEIVIKAIPEVIKHIPNLVYIIAGTGEEESRLKEMVDKLKIRAHVIFTGFMEKELLPQLYNACDIFVMPSYERQEFGDFEGFGIAFLEANACEKPVIGGRSGGIEDAVVDGETGLLVDSHNVSEIIDAVVRLLKNRDLAEKLGQNGRDRVEKKLSWQKIG